MRTFEISGQLDGHKNCALRKGNLDPEDHSQQSWCRTKHHRSGRRNVRLCLGQAELGNLCRGNILRKSVSRTNRCGQVLRSLQEAAAMLFLARRTGSGERQRSRLAGLAQPRTTRMACGHDVVVSRHVPSHFTRRMHMPGMHEEHRRHGHLCPSHHPYQ